MDKTWRERRDDDLKITFAKNLTRLLYERGKTQADLYKYMGVSSAAVSDWCNGKKMPRSDKLQAIANLLCVNISDLLFEKSEDIEINTALFNEKREEQIRKNHEDFYLSTFDGLLGRMSEPSKKELIAYAEWLIAKENNRG